MNDYYITNYTELDKLTEEGYLRKVEQGNLVAYNYTDKCTYEKKWNKYTLNCRGSVYAKSTGELIARAFPKFFNFEELAVSKQRNLLKQKDFEVYEKMDGSLGIVYYYDGKWRVNTRGSFTSDQAIKATEMLSKYKFDRLTSDVFGNYTFLVEIIYPDNKIIVDYGKEEKLVLLGAYDSRYEDVTDGLANLAYTLGLELPEKYTFESIDKLIEWQLSLPATEEGCVVRFKNGERVKFKSKEYLRVARILQRCTPLALWETMVNGQVSKEFLESVPEEFRKEVDQVTMTLEYRYLQKYKQIYDTMEYVNKHLFNLLPPDLTTTEKCAALGKWLKNNPLEHGNILFSILRGKNYNMEKYIMKLIKPKGNVL